ncbi:hypothetical protein [Actinoplanes subtropicus]|uniref:hypothetical protein n=1 Tax=Actinoplanes subtropicus TaxID=543632 RepID=UPI0004C311F2|nr:hypothetical protein [Actinoplanes subtropicus]
MTNLRKAGVVIAAGIAAVTFASAADAATTPWTVAPSDNAATGDTQLTAVSAVDATHAFAVGSAGSRTIAERWDGTRWSLLPTPTPDSGGTLLGVSAVSSTDVWAVGSGKANATANQHALIEHFDGASWTIVPNPSNGVMDSLRAVSARSATDVWAVGTNGQNTTTLPLVEHWNGTSWSIVASARLGASATGFFNGVTTSPNGDVWAVGTVTAPAVPEGSNRAALIERWNGSAFVQVAAPPTADPRFTTTLTAVAESGSDDVYAVGAFGHSGIALHWNGTAWSTITLPAVANSTVTLNAVTVAGPNDAWFAGIQGLATVTEQSTSTSSAIVASPSGAQRGSLAGLAHAGPALFAVGFQINDPATFQDQTLALTNAAG